ncbi:lysostaphin resistance A-like protein [Candidatus Latescibacterota bacterium]
MEQHLERSDLRLIGICVAITAASLLVGTHFFYQAFPEATIDFAITRDEARARAQSFLEYRGLDVEEYRHSAVFEFSNDTKTFLERELGLEGASACIGNPVRLWRWSNRWARELEKEEFGVQYTTSGDLVGFSHQIEEEAAGAALSQEAARELAEQFVVHTVGRALSELEFVEAETRQRPNRTDHSFTWKLSDFELEGATYRYEVGIHGDLVGHYKEFLKIPEEWQREYSQLRSRNTATGMAASALLTLTWVAMLVFLIIGIRGQDVRWRTALVFGGICAVIVFLAQLNALPVAEHEYATTATYGSFISQQILISLLAAIGFGVLITFLVAAGEPVYRRRYGEQVSLTELFLLDGIRTKRFLMGTIIGLTMTAGFMAYVTLFYLVAGKFGAWTPADIPYREMVNTHIPWIYVLFMGFFPAVSEELTSRAFSIPFFERYLKHRWAAVLVAALIWGFAHASYPQQPFYIRGIEVGIAGVVFGYVMIRWGLLPVLVCHYTIDALMTAMVLLRSTSSYFVISAAVSGGLFLLPLAISVGFYLKNRFFIDPSSLLNREDTAPLPAPLAPAVMELSPEARLLETLPDETSTYVPLSPRRLLIAGGVVLASLAAYFVPVDDPPGEREVAVTPARAEALATTHLLEQGVDADAYRAVVTHERHWDGNAARYRLERGGLDAVTALYGTHLRADLWRVRFFQPMEKEEYRVWIDPADSSVYTMEHLLPEDEAGADLSEDEARSLAQAHLRSYGLDPSEFVLKESSSEKMKARRDYRFLWEARQGDPRNLDESYFRCTVEIAGDQPTALSRDLKLPEAWLRDHEESSLLDIALWGILGVVCVAVFIHLIVVFIRLQRDGSIAWRRPLLLGAVWSALLVAGFVNDLPVLFGDYRTDTTTTVFLVSQLVKYSLLAMVSVAMGALLVALASGLFPQSLDRLRARARAPMLRDAILVAVLVWIGGSAIDRLRLLLADWLAPHINAPTPSFASGATGYLPWLDGLSAAVGAGIFLPFGAAVAVYYATRVLRTPTRAVLALLVLGVATCGSAADTAGQFYVALALYLFDTGLTVAVVGWYLRDNIAAYVLVGFLPRALDIAQNLLSQEATLYRWNGAFLTAAAVVIVVLLWLQSRRAVTQREGPRLTVHTSPS